MEPAVSSLDLTINEPRYEAGWMRNDDELRPEPFVAFLRPYHEGWYDLFPTATWLEAVSKALQITREVRDCEYVGGWECRP